MNYITQKESIGSLYRYLCVCIGCILISLVLLTPAKSSAQILNDPHSTPIDTDSARRDFDKLPYFGVYKDNYFTFGTSIGPKPTRENSNVKFQISIRQKLTKTTLPWDTYLYLYYTQKVIWNVLVKSVPMKDINFNPGIGLARPFFKDGKYAGRLRLELEHESNGRDSTASRSWNRVSIGGDAILTNNVAVFGKIWVPIVDGQYNRDLLKYVGLFQAGVEYMSNNRRWKASLLFVKRATWKFDFNTVAELSWQFSKKTDWSLFMQYYNGYGECLLDYNKFASQLRFGIVIRPPYFSDY